MPRVAAIAAITRLHAPAGHEVRWWYRRAAATIVAEAGIESRRRAAA